MKKVFFLINVVLFSSAVFSQSYWNEEFKVASSIKLKDGYITLEKKINTKSFRKNPDGTVFYKTTFGIGIQKAQQKRMSVIETDVYTSDNYLTGMSPCMLFDTLNNAVWIFTNSKDAGAMYGMEGYVYRINLETKTWQKEMVFKSANWGWFSFFGGVQNGNPQLLHFSYAGYYAYKSERDADGRWSNNNLGSIKPEIAANQYFTHDNILITSLPDVDNFSFSGNYYTDNYSAASYNNGGSSISLNDVFKAASNLYAGYKIIRNLWDAGENIKNNSITLSTLSERILKCAAYSKVSGISSNPFISATLSQSVQAILDKQKLTLESIGYDVLQQLVIDDLNSRGQNSIAEMMGQTSLLKCLTNK